MWTLFTQYGLKDERNYFLEELSVATSGKLPLNIAAIVRIVCSACQMGGCSVVNLIRCYVFILLTRVKS